MRRIALAMVCALLLGATSASGALATTTRIPTNQPGSPADVINPGTWTMNGTVESVRGLVMSDTTPWGVAYVDGLEVNTVNWDLDYATGSGSIWGTGVHYPTAYPGSTWRCTFQQTFTNFHYAGKGVCQGTGALHTWQWRVNLYETPEGNTGATGYIFKPGD